MIRTENVAIAAIRGEAQLRNAYGFAWNTYAPENTVSFVAIIRGDVEYADGSRAAITVRPGVWYGGGRLITRAWFTSSPGGVAVFDVGQDPGDVANPSPPSAEPDASGELVASWRGAVGGAVRLSGALRLPRGTRALLWLGIQRAHAAATPVFGVIELTMGTGDTIRLAKGIGTAAAVGTKVGMVIGSLGGGTVAGFDAVQAGIGNLNGGNYQKADLTSGGTFPRNVQLAVYDSTAGNSWDVDAYAL